MTIRPRRSVLFMPGSNERALEKAKTLPADVLIFDLEDAVAPAMKQQARERVVETVNQGGYGEREIAVRINGLDSPLGQADLEAVAAVPLDAVVVPKVESAETVLQVAEALDSAQNQQATIWVQAETPLGVLRIEEIAAAHPRNAVILMGTSDLSKELRVPHSRNRLGFLHVLSQCVLAARAYGLDVIDGVQLDLDDMAWYEIICQQGRDLGFDGKSLIHPKQLAAANRIYAPSVGQIDHAERIIEAWREAEKEGQGICVVDGKLIENLHIEEAQRVLALNEAIERLST